MNKLQFPLFLLPVWVFVCALVSCSESEDEPRSNRYGTYVSGEDAVFSFDEDNCPYLPVRVPSFSEEELKRMLVGYKWVEVPDSAYIIQEDGTCISATAWYYLKYYRYDYVDLFINDSTICFYKGWYNWEELKKMNRTSYWSRVEAIRDFSFERNSCNWVFEFNDKRFSLFRIVYFDGQRMVLIRTFTGTSWWNSPTNGYAYTTYLNEGPSNFLDTLLHEMDYQDSVRKATFPEVYSVRLNGVACEWTEKR